MLSGLPYHGYQLDFLLHVDGSRNRPYGGPDLKLIILVSWGWVFFVCCFAHRSLTEVSIFFQLFCLIPRGQYVVSVESSILIHHMILFVIYLFCCDDSLAS